MIFDIEKEIKYPKSMVEYKEKCFAKLKQVFKNSKLSGYSSWLLTTMDVVNFEVRRYKESEEQYLDDNMFPPFDKKHVHYSHKLLLKSAVWVNEIIFKVKINFDYCVWNDCTDWYRNKFLAELNKLGINYEYSSSIVWQRDNENGSKNFGTSILVDFSKQISDKEMNKIIEEYNTMNKK